MYDSKWDFGDQSYSLVRDLRADVPNILYWKELGSNLFRIQGHKGVYCTRTWTYGAPSPILKTRISLMCIEHLAMEHM